MRSSLFIALLLGYAGALFSNTINQGTTLTIVSGTTVTNIGNFNNQTGTIINNGTLEIVDGVFANTGTPAVGGMVVIRGTDCALAGNSTFNDVELNTTNPTEVLGGTSTFDNNLYVKAGNLTLLAGNVDYGVNANLIYNGVTPTLTGAEFPILHANYNPKTIRINNPAGVTMQSNGQVLYTLILEQGLLTSNGKLYIASTATQTGIVDDFTGVFTGDIAGSMTVERFVTNPPNVAQPPYAHFHYIGTPLIGATASGWADDFSLATMNGATNGAPIIPYPDCRLTALQNNSPYGGLFTYDESIVSFCQLQGWRVRTGVEPADRGKGFAGIIGNNALIDLSGTYSKADVSFTFSSTGTDTAWRAFHIVSNPFCAPIDWDVNYALIGGNASDIDGNAYLYNPDGGVYEVYNNINQGVIGTSQGFFVRAKPSIRYSPATTFNVTMDNDSRVTTDNNTFYRIGQPYEFALKINITNPNNRTDNTLLAFDPSFHDDFDNGFDATKLYSDAGVPSIYTKSMRGEKLTIQAIPVNTGLITIPLSVKTQGTGSFTMDFDQVHTFPSTMMITLEDLKTGTFQDIRMNPQYVFSGTINDANDRFLLHFTPQLIVNTNPTDCGGRNGFIALEQQGGVVWNYSLIDEEGNLVTTESGYTAYDTISALAPGHYTIRLSHSSGYQTVEEVIVHGMPEVETFISSSATEVEEDEELSFNATGNATQYTCDMGDGTILTNVNSTFRYTYAVPGNYTVRLTGSNGTCIDVVTLNITVTAKDVTAENPNPNPENPPISTAVTGTDEQSLTVYHFDGKLFIKQTLNRSDSRMEAGIFNALGQQLQIISGALPYNQQQGYDLNDLPSGPLFVRVQLGDATVTKKIVQVR